MIDYGDPILPARFWDKVYPEPNTGCWLWGAGNTVNNYGRIRVGGKRGPQVMVHRYLYETVFGRLAPGLVVDHVCHTRDTLCPGGKTCPHRSCVNPEHLAAATQGENIRAGRGVAARRAKMTHCGQGHEFTYANTRIERTGSRRCLTCKRDRERVA